jgi:SP family general alpha glucoside:H+ symporter-like MFS transporter
MLLALNVKAAFVYGAFSVPICVLMWFLLPETKGYVGTNTSLSIRITRDLTSYSRSTAEIDELYENRIPAWRWSETVTAVEEQMHVVVQVKGSVKENQGHAQA